MTADGAPDGGPRPPKVRRARIQEIRALAEQYARELADRPPSQRDVPMPQGGVFWIAERAGEALGYAAGTLRPSGCVVGPVYTVPDHRNEGVGRALLEAVQRWAEGTRVPIVDISVAVGNDGGIAFLESLGYEARRTLMSLTPTARDD